MPNPIARRALFAGALILIAGPAQAGDADVIGVQVRSSGNGVYDFDVTIRSNDTGWSFYADQFEVLAPDGRVLGARELLHPHDDEQPFTRDLYGVRIPAGVSEVLVRARHKPRGYNGATMRVRLPR